MLRFSQLMTEFSYQVGIGEPSADEEGCYYFHVDDIRVRCFEINSRIYLQADLKALPSQESEQLDYLKRALKLGLANPMSSKASLTVDEDGGLTLFDRYSETVIELEPFKEWFGDFLDSFEFFQKHLDESVDPVIHAQSSGAEQIFIG